MSWLAAICCGLMLTGCALSPFSPAQPGLPVKDEQKPQPDPVGQSQEHFGFPPTTPEATGGTFRFSGRDVEEKSVTGKSRDLSVWGSVAQDADALVRAARSLWEEDRCKDPQTALAMLDAAAELEPAHKEAFLWRGRVLGDMGYLEDSFDDLTRAIRLKPSALAYACRALTGMRLGNMEGADQDLAQALSLDPHEPHALVYRAARFFLTGDDAQACSDLGRACLHGLCHARQKAEAEGLCR